MAETTQQLTGTHRAIRFHPPSFDIRVEEILRPQIIDPDDAIVKVTLAALCGSDLHIYRGHAKVTEVHTCGHEFIGEIVELGASYTSDPVAGRPHGYSSLRVGNKVVSPFTVNCGECHVCRLGYTCRCPQGALFGSPKLDGGQAQYVRVPKAGGTLFNLSDPVSWANAVPTQEVHKVISSLSDPSLLLLADILPTGVFAALQALSHPKVTAMTSGSPWPSCLLPNPPNNIEDRLHDSDRILTLSVIGLGPVGICTMVSVLDMLTTRGLPFRIVGIDPNRARREKMTAIYRRIYGDGNNNFIVQDIEEAKATVETWTGGVGCTAILEVVGNNSALTLAYDLVRPFGAITTVGVHGKSAMPFTGEQLYNKNVSFDFGRCPARSMFPLAFELLVKRQDVFGTIGEPTSLVEKIAGFKEADEMYRAFEKGAVGKVVFDPWE